VLVKLSNPTQFKIHQLNKNSYAMRKLLFFMVLVGLFVFGGRSFIGMQGCGFGPRVQGEGPVTTVSRPEVTGFKSVDLGISGDLEISQGDTYAVEVIAQQNLHSVIKTEVSGGKLRIYFDKNVSSNERILVRVTAPTFDGTSVSGSGTIKALTPIRGAEFSLAVSGAGDVQIADIQVDNLDCGISGSGNLTLGGVAKNCKISVSGSGGVKAPNLQTNVMDAHISGSGDVRCAVAERLEGSVSGSGNITYSGRPIVDLHTSGSGDVQHVE
jgi:hypothetical protein